MTAAVDKRFNGYREGYARLWRGAEVLPERQADVRRTAAILLANKPRYLDVSADTGVPWFVVGLIHKMECSHWPRFDQHLHNGDPLTARTRLVPRGRPKSGSPPFTFEESAIDALKYDGLDAVGDWSSVERVAYELEKFNGFGYRKFGVPTPYLWSFTNRYAHGKFVSDGQYDPSAVSEQSGAMAVLKALVDLDPSIRLNVGDSARVATNEGERLPKAEDTKIRNSITLYGLAITAASAVWSFASNVLGIFGEHVQDVAQIAGEVAENAGNWQAPISSVINIIGINLPWLPFAAVAIGILLAAQARISASRNKKVG